METLDSSNSNGAPLTEEQLAYFSESEKRVVESALKRYQRRAVFGFLILLLGIGFNLRSDSHHATEQRHAVVQSGRAVAVDGCNRDFHTIQALRGVLTSARAQTESAVRHGRVPADQAQEARKFYSTQLTKLRLPDCRLASDVLTDDPNNNTVIPQPLYPKPVKGQKDDG